MSKIFLDSEKAATFMGLSRRHFERQFIDTGKVRVLRFNPSSATVPRGDGKHIFLVEELRKVKREAKRHPSSN